MQYCSTYDAFVNILFLFKNNNKLLSNYSSRKIILEVCLAIKQFILILVFQDLNVPNIKNKIRIYAYINIRLHIIVKI